MGIVVSNLRWSDESGQDVDAKKTAVVLLRWVLVITTSCLILFSDSEGKSLASQLVVLALILSNILIASFPAHIFRSKNFDSMLVSADIVFISIGLWASGHANGDFYLLYFLIIMIAALGETLRSILWSACLVALVYGGVTLTTSGGNALLQSSVLMRIPFFFIVAIFYGYFAQLVRAERSARVNYEAKWTVGKRLREVGYSLTGSLDRSQILQTLVQAQLDLCSVPYCAVFSRGSKGIIAEAGELAKRPSPEKMFSLCGSLERRIPIWERGRSHLEESSDDDAGPTISKGSIGKAILNEQSMISFVEEQMTLLPVSPMVESDLYLMLDGQIRSDLLEYAPVLLLNASMALHNAGQFQALVHEAEKRQEVNRQLSEAIEFRSQFLANISHEIRTPIHSFIGFGELFMSGGYGELTAEQASVIQRMMKNAKSLLDLINDILDLSKLEAGAMKVRRSLGSIPEFLDDVCGTCAPLLSDKPVAMQGTVVGDVPALYLDWQMLRQIAINLVSNAIKFTPKGRIDIGVHYQRQREKLLVVVRDTGVGIDPEKFQEIFEPFRQLENSYTKKYAGTGLGLAISKRQAELMGGGITVRSKLGAWSEFTLQIPANSRAESSANISENSELLREGIERVSN